MEIIKFGVIGFIIMAPLIFIGWVSSSGNHYEERTEQHLKVQLEEAVYDGAFAMKTYSEFYYDADEAYTIDVPYEQVIDTFYSSLEFRDFDYAVSDFPFMVFVEYDGVVIYLPEYDKYLPKLYYAKSQDGEQIFATLSGEALAIDMDDMKAKEIVLSDSVSNRIVLQTVEDALNKGAMACGMSEEIIFTMPEADNGFFDLALNDLSFCVVYDSERYSGVGFKRYAGIKPSGIMKMKEIISY